MSLRLTGNIIVLLVIYTTADNYEYEYGPEYGTEWMYFVADNGSTHVMNFSTLPADGRGILFGDAYFHLYTRRNSEDPELLTIPEDEADINSAHFNASNDIKAVTHGWLSDDNTEWLQNIKDAFLRKYDCNVITVDWSEISKNPMYPWPALSTRYVGKRLAKLLGSLEKTYQGQGKSVHLIGHSLGAHVMGYAGMFSEERIYRITGLDPARPMFEIPYMGADFRLEQSDAEFVDIIHTCGGMYGYKTSHGHADFYPNNGRPRQPGCEGPQTMIEGCSHGKACAFFGESIESDLGFTAYPCESWNQFEDGQCKDNSTNMGDPVSIESRGDYYLHTRNESKFAMGDEQNM